MAIEGVAGRLITLCFLASIVLSSATIYGYGSNWFTEKALEGSLERGITLHWLEFTLLVPGNPNRTTVMTSQFTLGNDGGADAYATSFEQRLYLIQFAAADMIADYPVSSTIPLPQGANFTLHLNVTVPYTSKAPLLITATGSNTWLWITHITLTVESGDTSLTLCFSASMINPPNSTSTGFNMPTASCRVPAALATGGEG